MTNTRARGPIGVVLAALALALMAVALVAFSGGPAEAKKPPKFRVVTKTFQSNAPIAISAGQAGVATPYPSERSSAGFKQGKVLDVDLTLKNFSHAFPDDVSVLLEGPGGRDAVVLADVGGDFENDVSNATLVLDDEASRSLPDSSQITGGRFKPTRGSAAGGSNPSPSVYPAPARFDPYAGTLRVFDGASANGTWKLFVFDDTSGDGGSIPGGYSVTIKAKVRR